jgi:hypothetical protein
MRIGTRLQCLVPDSCPIGCPHKHEPFDQGCTCSRCPVFNCNLTGGIRLLDPDEWDDEDAANWAAYLNQFVENL